MADPAHDSTAAGGVTITPGPPRLKLNVEEEPTDHYVQFTSSGAFQVGDFFRIDEEGYTLKQENGNIKTQLIQPTTTSTTQISTTPSSIADVQPPSAATSTVPSPSNQTDISDMTVASSSATPPTLSVTSLSDLIILNPIGQGASGLVQRVAHRLSPTTFLALKVVPLDLSESKSKQILIELRTLHYASHPNIVSFYGAFYKERSMSLVLEYMDRGSLSDCLKRIKLHKLKQQKKRRERRIRHWQVEHRDEQGNLPSPPSTLPPPDSPILSTLVVEEKYISCIARQLLSGLHYLHISRRLIHRDIKPSNILLNSSGQVKLADFGVSGELQETAGNENKISFVGTVTYMSPERIQGHAHSFDSDLWSLGLTLVELALGYFPYAKPQTSDGEDAEEFSSSDDDGEESSHESDDSMSETELDEQKDNPHQATRRRSHHRSSSSSTATRRPRHSSHGNNDSPSSSASSTPSHAAFSISSPTTSTGGEFNLAAPAGNKDDLYNATQTHIPGHAMPMRPISSPSSGTVIGRPRRPSFSIGSPTLPNQKSDRKQSGNRSRFGFWDIMQRIVQTSAPALSTRLSRKTGKPKYSDEFRSFVGLCLKKEPKERSTALELLSHPFITKYADVTLDEWLKTIPERTQSTQISNAITTSPSMLLTPSFRPSVPISSPSNGAANSSMMLSSPTASPLPPLPTHPGRPRHHSLCESPRIGSTTLSPLLSPSIQPSISTTNSTNGSIMEEESEIETFPVTPSVSGFANAYESVPFININNHDDASSMMTETTSSIFVHINNSSNNDSMNTSNEDTNMLHTPTTIVSLHTPTTATMPTINGTTASGSSRLKRKTTYDISVDVNENGSPILSTQHISSTSLAINSAPPSLRNDVNDIGAANSSSPPSGSVQGATPLKRQKSFETTAEPSFSGLQQHLSPPTNISSVGESIHSLSSTTATTTNSPSTAMSASATFAANLRLITANRFESMTYHPPQSHQSASSSHMILNDMMQLSSTPRARSIEVDDSPAASAGHPVDPSYLPHPLCHDSPSMQSSSPSTGHGHTASPSSASILTPTTPHGSGLAGLVGLTRLDSRTPQSIPTATSGATALISPFTPATSTNIHRFSLLKDGTEEAKDEKK